MRSQIIFYLNGQRQVVEGPATQMTLSDYIRTEVHLSGTKIVCAEGDCGACSVLRHSGDDSKDYQTINSCVTLLAQIDGMSIFTVEGLKSQNGLNEVQNQMLQCHGSQCGFCTPGFVMSLTGLVEKKISLNEKKIYSKEAQNHLTGNLCRCTGYAPIMEAATKIDLSRCSSLKERLTEHQLHDLKENQAEALHIQSKDFIYFAPVKVEDALHLLKQNPGLKILGGCTDLGVLHNKRKIKLDQILSLSKIASLKEISENNGTISVGASVTLSELRNFLKGRCDEFVHYLDLFASPAIKNMATVIGNIANASPIGDTPTALMALGAILHLEGPQGKRSLSLSDFFISYKKTHLLPGEILTKLTFNLPSPKAIIKFYKNSNRKDLDISALNLAAFIEWEDASKKVIKDFRLAAGGVGPIPMRLKETEKSFMVEMDTQKSLKILQQEITPISDLRASSSYRRIVLENMFRQFLKEIHS